MNDQPNQKRNTAMLDAVLMTEGMQTLIDRFGIVDAERFIGLMNQEPFDYTKFHHALFENMTVDEICDAADAASRELDDE